MPPSDRPDPELVELLEELSETLDELGDGIEGGERDNRPQSRDLVRFTESYTIPTVISLLEAAIQSLELLQGVLRLVGGRELDRDRGRGRTARSELGTVGRATFDSVDAALTELTAALEGEPPEGTARDLLRDARVLREEIDDRLGESRERADRSKRDRDPSRPQAPEDTDGQDTHEIPVQPESPEEPAADLPADPAVDVDAELASIKDEMRDDQLPEEGDRKNGSDRP